MDDGFIEYDPSWVEVGINGSHMVGPHHMLFEGNESFNYDSDNTHGNSIYHTVFRNHLSGFRRSFTGHGRTPGPAGLMYGSWWHSFVGNVHGDRGPDERLDLRGPGHALGRRPVASGGWATTRSTGTRTPTRRCAARSCARGTSTT